VITLLGVTGNTIRIHMGGGCQGCAASTVTLKEGIHKAFRQAVPQIGAILDETDHSAGTNPYYDQIPMGMRQYA
jgi:Fe-S cluster biogenesis protein NfuA